jgi:heptosyltransferase-2
LQRILILQPAFLGDVVLALPLAQVLRAEYPKAEIHFLVRKGNESLLANHPAIDRFWIWNKQQNKHRNLIRLVLALRRIRFDLIVNPHRFLTSGMIAASIPAKAKTGFDKNPLSWACTHVQRHSLGPDGDSNHWHEVQRNHSLLLPWLREKTMPTAPELRPKLYPSHADYERVQGLKSKGSYVVVAPASVWFTKQWPQSKWVEMLGKLPTKLNVYLAGAPSDHTLCESLITTHPLAANLAGQLSLLQTAALMDGAARVFANDSAPLHLASAMNAPTTALFCSTIPAFGFGPLADNSQIMDIDSLGLGPLACRPCGLHGHKSCPKGHFDCANKIDSKQVAETFSLNIN